MRIYGQNGQLKKVICNQCRREFEAKQTTLECDWLAVDKEWGFFSKKDGRIHSFDLCEDCYDRLVKGLAIAPEEREQTELV